MPPRGVAMSEAQKAKISAANTRPEPTEKCCVLCRATKPVSEFERRGGSAARWYRSECRACRVTSQRLAGPPRPKPERSGGEGRTQREPKPQREPRLKKPEREPRPKNPSGRISLRNLVAGMESKQAGLCAACGCAPSVGRLVPDLDPSTRRPRALVCRRCHRGLGLLDRNPDFLEMAACYVERHSPPPTPQLQADP